MKKKKKIFYHRDFLNRETLKLFVAIYKRIGYEVIIK